MIICLHHPCKTFTYPVSSSFLGSPKSRRIFPFEETGDFISCSSRRIREGLSIRRRKVAVFVFLPVDPWAPLVDSESIASQLFAASLFPYLGFLYFITKSKSSPKLTLFGFYFLLAFVGATTKVHYGTSLSNVDWLHGGAESLLTLTNLFIVIGLRQALRKSKNENVNESMKKLVAEAKDEKSSV